MERAVQIFAAVNFLVIGLSHVFQPVVWVDFFLALRDKGRAGVFEVAFLSLTFGSIIVAFHNLRTDLPMALTLIGWAQVTKALIYFVFPGYGLRKISTVSRDRAHWFVAGGVVSILLGVLLVVHLAKT